MQHEITTAKPLLNDQGDLNEPGYAKKLLPIYNKPDTHWYRFHTKEWDYYYIGNQHHGFALTVADNGYMGLDSISFLDFDQCWQVTRSAMQFFTMGKKKLPATSVTGDIASESANCKISFVNKTTSRHLKAWMKDFKDGKELQADIELAAIPEESMVICTPFDKPRHFYFNQKINTMRASGTVTIGSTVYHFKPEESFGTLDWGRGVWTYQNTWYWSSLNADIGGHAFGFNLGYGFGNTKAASENMFFYDGVAYKLDQVTFNIPQKDGKDDLMAPWTFTSNDGSVDLKFEPILDRAADTNVLIIRSNQHQVFGRFSGHCQAGNHTIVLDHKLGFAEKVYNRW